jgi:hypothetical protein
MRTIQRVFFVHTLVGRSEGGKRRISDRVAIVFGKPSSTMPWKEVWRMSQQQSRGGVMLTCRMLGGTRVLIFLKLSRFFGF